MLEDLIKRLNEKKIAMELTDNAKDFLIEKGYDPVYGARPLRRAIQKMLEDPLAERILGGQSLTNQKVIIDRDKDALVFKVDR